MNNLKNCRFCWVINATLVRIGVCEVCEANLGEHLALAKREPDIVLLADVCFSFCPSGRFPKMDKIDFLSLVLAKGVGVNGQN